MTACQAAPAPSRLAVDLAVGAGRWDRQRGARALMRRALVAAYGGARRHAAVAVLLTDDAGIRALNRQWRGQDKPTNVLSFPAPASPGRPAFLGDIAIAYETVAREAAAEGKPFAHHLAHLAVHGLLHLLGFDHLTAEQAETMERRERAILARLRIPDPYAGSEPARAINARS